MNIVVLTGFIRFHGLGSGKSKHSDNQKLSEITITIHQYFPLSLGIVQHRQLHKPLKIVYIPTRQEGVIFDLSTN